MASINGAFHKFFDIYHSKSHTICNMMCRTPQKGFFRFLTRTTLLLVVAAILGSCASSKPAAGELEALSGKFGVNLTKRDNIKLYREAAGWLGVRYRSGGTSKQGVDCSGFTGAVYRSVYGAKLNRTVEDIYNKDCRRIRQSKLKEGDLVFFHTDKKGRKKKPNHVGIYLKNGRFVHASSSKGVEVNTLSNPYYKKAFIKGGRVAK